MMERNRKKVLLLGGLAGVGCIIVIVLIFVLWGGPREAGRLDYPPLDPGEKLPHIGHVWRNPRRIEVPEFEFDGPFPDAPAEMLVYKVGKPKQVSEAEAREMAKKYFDIPMDAEALHSTTSYIFKTENLYFHFQLEMGLLNMGRYEKARIGLSEDRKDYPSDKKCKAIAVKFAKSRGFLPRDAYVSVIADDTKSTGGMSVIFRRIIGGYKSLGARSSMIVRVGVGGEIIKVLRQWQVLEPYKMAPIITPEKAFEELKRGNGFIAFSGAKCKVEEMTLRYDTQGMLDYVQPIYYFKFAESGYGVVAAVKAEHSLTVRETYDIQTRKYDEQRRAKDPNK
ncbi:MAG: hypothetical protein ACYS8Z_21440 [Planctomycetota bacterium]|jgi:hypothetical protein